MFIVSFSQLDKCPRLVVPDQPTPQVFFFYLYLHNLNPPILFIAVSNQISFIYMWYLDKYICQPSFSGIHLKIC